MRVLGALALLVVGAVAAGDASGSGTWTKAPYLPTPRSAHAVVVAAGAIHALGGPGSTRIDRFDGRRWRREGALPGGVLNAPAAVGIGTSVYVIGGFGGATNVPTSRVRVLDVSSGRWRDVAPLPAPRGGHAAALLGGRIHVLGGGNAVSTIADHSVYDPATNSWSEAAPLPRPEGSPAAVVRDGKLYAIGGRSGLEDYGDAYVYDPLTDSWSRGPAIPPRGTVGAVVWRRSIYVFGGESQAKGIVLSDVYRLAPGASRWQRVSRMPTARSYARSVVFRGRIYVAGGSTTPGLAHSANGSRVVETFVPGRG
jgi:N-acetylneuraminic acid mutarotase